MVSTIAIGRTGGKSSRSYTRKGTKEVDKECRYLHMWSEVKTVLIPAIIGIISCSSSKFRVMSPASLCSSILGTYMLGRLGYCALREWKRSICSVCDNVAGRCIRSQRVTHRTGKIEGCFLSDGDLWLSIPSFHYQLYSRA